MAWEIIGILFYLVPAYIANMTPVFASKLGWLQIPINNKQFGSHKTWGGMLFGILTGTILGALFLMLYNSHTNLHFILLAFLLSTGALLGDLFKSYFKRRMKIAPGKTWIPFDQLDFVVGAIALASIMFFPGWFNVAIMLVGSFILHVIVNAIGYWLKLRKQWI